MPFTTMPFGMTTSEQDAWYYYGGGEALAKEVFDKHGVNQYQGGSTVSYTHLPLPTSDLV